MGLRLKTWDLSRTIPQPPIVEPILTEFGDELLTEYDTPIFTE